MAGTIFRIDRELMLDPLPALNHGLSHTTSSALHDLKFVGIMRPWPAFEVDVWRTFNQQQWDNVIQYIIPRNTGLRMGMLLSIVAVAALIGSPIAGALVSADGGGFLYAFLCALLFAQMFMVSVIIAGTVILVGSVVGAHTSNFIRDDFVQIGNEHFLQGRFVDRVGQVVTQIAQHQGLGFAFSSPQNASIRYSVVPDFTIIDQNGILLVVGEMKVYWVGSHLLEPRFELFEQFRDENDIRVTLGQIANYMQVMGLRYAFHTTYEETVFLRQVQHNGRWILEYSPVIHHTAIGIHNLSQPAPVSLRQCFLHIALLAQADPQFDGSGLRRQKWVEKTEQH